MSKIANYTDAIRYIYSFIHTDRKPSPKAQKGADALDRLRDFLAKLGNPQNAAPVLLIGGTKGKGSTAAMCESMLRAAAYKTGFYSSPHLHSFRERIRINGQLIEEEQLLTLINELQPHIEATPKISAWEIMTALGFMAFAQANVEVMVLEVGLGGRTDPTNVSHPLVSVITPISYDHVEVLGKTLRKIAGEKAGIIRPNSTAVIAPQYPEALGLFEEVCAARATQMILIGDAVNWQVKGASLRKQRIQIDQQVYHLSLLGPHQASNAATAVTAVKTFTQALERPISEAAITAGLAQVEWPGRFEILSQDPMLVVDSAMNGDSARRLQESLSHYFYGRNIILIFGATRDHNYTAMLNQLLPQTRHTIATRSGHLKAISPAVLGRVAKALGTPVSLTENIEQALQVALSLVAEDDVICVTGSLFCAAEARVAWANHVGLPLPAIDDL